MSLSNQDRLDTIKALFHINQALMQMIDKMPDNIKVDLQPVLASAEEAQLSVRSMLERLDKDLSNVR